MLILWGVDEFSFPVRDFLPDWRTRFPQAKVQLLEQAGHYVVEDAHERIIPQMLEFLGSNL
jgi:haloalkane dehalogenase